VSQRPAVNNRRPAFNTGALWDKRGKIKMAQNLKELFFYYTDVTLAIDEIPGGASPGPDGVPHVW
jgi:hypothetical protein